MYVYLYTTYISGANRGWKKGSDPLVLKAPMALNCHMGAENQT